MVFEKYFLKKYFKYFATISILLTLLFNSIDFFEKFIRVKNITSNQILYYITLNLIPSFFYYLPISGWLATCFVIRELQQQNEWQILPILSISYNKVLKLLFSIGIFLVIFNFTGKEQISFKLQNKADQFKNRHIKKQKTQKVLNKWFCLPNNIFCHLNYLDLKTNTGSGITFVKLDSNFAPQKIISGKKFYLNLEEKTINIDNASQHKFAKNKMETKDKKLKLPAIFPYLQLSYQTPSIVQISKTLIYSKNVISNKNWHELLYLLLQRILMPLQLILYMILTFCLFLLFPFNTKHAMFATLLPYPTMTFLEVLTDFIRPHFNFAWIVFLPYLILSLTFLFLWKKQTGYK